MDSLAQALLNVVQWARQAGPAAAILYGAIYILATVSMLPGALLTLGAGFIYGPLGGLLLVSPASVAGATCSFLLGRTVARGWIARRLDGNPRFAAIDRAVESDGFRLVFLLRLSPVVPFNLLNYALGLTRVTLRDFILASFLGMLPGTLLYVYLGSVATSATQLLQGNRPAAGPWGELLYWGGLLATVVVTVQVTRLARRALDSTLEPSPSALPKEPSA